MRTPVAVFAATIVAVAACGARSGLEVDVTQHQADAGPAAADAGPGVVDSGPDVVDSGPDVVMVDECADAGTTFIYLVTEENELFRFYPPDHTFVPLFTIDCPGEANQTPFSMAVDRKGAAYVVFNDGNLFRVGLASKTCEATAFVPTPFGAGAAARSTFGMGFSANVTDPGETLFVASDDPLNGPQLPELLGTIDVNAFKLAEVGQLPHVIGSAELTGTGDGQLYGFGVDNTGAGTVFHFLQFDKTSAGLLDDQTFTLSSGTVGLTAWAFAFWGGDFYVFTSTVNGSSMVSQYHQGDPAAVPYAMLAGKTIVGAGVSTCAPQN